MTENLDLDLEIVDIGVAYNLYSIALVSLAIALNTKRDSIAEQQSVSKYAKKLQDALFRCGIDQEIPLQVGDGDNILRFFQRGELLHQISNQMVRHYTRRQELIFILSCVVTGVISGTAGGVSQATTEPAKSQAIAIGR